MNRHLVSSVMPVASLTPELVTAIYALFERSYDEVSPEQFRADLFEKAFIVLLRDLRSGSLVGFSTLLLMQAQVDGQPLQAIFSGDTIINRSHWGSPELVRAWCHFAGQIKHQRPNVPLYWFLISKGYRTYLFLPLYFREFYPRVDRVTPIFERRVLAALAAARYPSEYDPTTGLIKFARSHGHLNPGLASVSPHLLSNPHVRFFLERNPGYAGGDELACLAEVKPDNMVRLARRTLEEAMTAPSCQLLEASNA